MNDYLYAVREITELRRADLDDGILRWQKLLAENPALDKAHAEYQDQAVLKAQKLPNSFDIARAALEAEMKKLGVDRSSFVPPYRCEKCHDTGYVDGRFCTCVVKRVINSDGENTALPHVDFDEAQSTAPKAIAKLYKEARDYIEAYPNDRTRPFFIMIGSSGTGKTVLASAISSALMQKGASVVSVGAFEFVKRAKDFHTQFAISDYRNLFTPMLDCDVLCIDDLGTEVMLKNITVEYLYSVINERWLHKKYTVVTTNLKPQTLIERYGEFVFSRLCDKNTSRLFNIAASNARIKKD